MNKKTVFLLAAILVFAVILRLIFFSGVGGSDDVLYTSYANQLSKDNFNFPATHHGTRLGILYPVGFLYALFGVTEFSSNILIFVTSIAGILLAFYFGKEFFSEEVGLIAAFLLSFFPLDVVFATKLLPDMPSAFFMSMGVFFFLLAEKNSSALKSKINYTLSGLSIGVAYMIRESAILIILFFLAYALFYRKFKLNYFLVFAGFAVVFIIESFIFLANTGDFLYRLHSLTSYYPTVVELDEFFGRGSFPVSLFHFPYIMFTSVQFGIFFPFILIAIFYNLKTRNKKSYPFMIWFLSLLVYLSFGTVSFTEYLLFAAIPRYLMVITFPSMILLAVFLSDKAALMRKILLPSILALLLATSLGFVYLDKGARHSIDNAKEINDYISSLDKPVYTDYRSKIILGYLSGYVNLNLEEFMHIKDGKTITDADLGSVKDSYIFVDHALIKNLLEPHPFIEFPEEIYNPPKNWVIVKKVENEEGDAILYYAP